MRSHVEGHASRGHNRLASKAARWALGLLIASLVLASCGGSEGSGQEGSAEGLTPVTFRLNFPASGFVAPFYLAASEGYYEEEGLDVEVLPGKTTQLTINDVNAGGVDIGLAGSPNVMLSVGKGLEVISVASYVGEGSFGVFAPSDSDIGSVEDLAGKSMLVTSGSPQTAILPAWFEANDVDPGSVELISLSPDAFVNAYAGGQGDSMSTSIPFGRPLVEENRPSRSFLWSETGLPLPDYSIIVKPEFLEENREVVRGFVRATLRAAEEAARDPEAAVEPLVEANPALQADTSVTSLTNFLPFFCSPGIEGPGYGLHVEEEYRSAAEVLAEYADLEGSLDPERFYTNSLFEGDQAVTAPECPLVGGSASE